MYIHDEEETIESLESRALDQAIKHLDRVWDVSFDDVLQNQSLALAYLALLVAGKTHEATLVKKMAKLDDEAERAIMALWVLGARLELPGYKDEWQEQARDSWCLMLIGSALQNIEAMDD